MKLYPVMVNMEGRSAVVIGGGEVALRKIMDLHEAGARVTVISPHIHPNIFRMAEGSGMILLEKSYEAGDLDGASLVISATDDPAVNNRVFNEAQKNNILVNTVDDPGNCSFFVPSSFKKGDLIVAVSSGGVSPSMSAKIRRDIENSIPGDIEEKLEALREIRDLLKKDSEFSHLKTNERGQILKKIVADDVLLNRALVSNRVKSLKNFITELLTNHF
ncbi:MAG: bifunctional precorrin-2 dehydrogenase/sirohydrochlorin ferrochelatase [Spirochaetes bacterium]|jgi:precorrin-2 dehydrogenase/sirohydrochlorin ferrochelatase|nr:bifunctional precorrin-2 dehydrogenase/sirohydrochlorin ferrochelatase [Spirochaetota bacterium]